MEIEKVWIEEFGDIVLRAESEAQVDMVTVYSKSHYFWPDWNKIKQEWKNNVQR